MEAPRDQNHIFAKMGVWCVDGITPIPIAINPVGGGIMVDSVSTISYNPADIAPRDGDYQTVWLGQSSTSNSVLPINVNALGAVLIAT